MKIPSTRAMLLRHQALILLEMATNYEALENMAPPGTNHIEWANQKVDEARYGEWRFGVCKRRGSK